MSLLSLLLFAHQKSREGRAGRLQFLPLWWQEGGKEGTSRCRMHYEKKGGRGFSGCRFRAQSEEGEREREKGGNGKTTAHTTHSYQPTFSRFFRGNVFFRAPENNCRRRRRFLLVSSPVILEEKRREPLSFFTHRGILSLSSSSSSSSPKWCLLLQAPKLTHRKREDNNAFRHLLKGENCTNLSSTYVHEEEEDVS